MKTLTIQDYETLIAAIDGWIAGRPAEIMTDQMKDAVILKAWLILAKHELEDKERGKSWEDQDEITSKKAQGRNNLESPRSLVF